MHLQNTFFFFRFILLYFIDKGRMPGIFGRSIVPTILIFAYKVSHTPSLIELNMCHELAEQGFCVTLSKMKY